MTATSVRQESDTPALGGEAYTRTRRLIVRGRLAPGVRLSEDQLAVQLRMSRTPVRDAMRRLLAEGLLVVDGGGSRPRLAVAPVSALDVRELYEVAGALEGVAVRRIDDLRAGERRSMVAELRRCETRFRATARHRPLDYDRLFDSHNAVHGVLLRTCAGPAIRALLDALRPRLDRYEWLYAPLIGPDFSATFAEHAEIVRAAAEGDGVACEEAVRANWFEGGQRLSAVLSASTSAA